MSEQCLEFVELSDALNSPIQRITNKIRLDNHLQVSNRKRHSSENVDPKNVNSIPINVSPKASSFINKHEAVAETEKCNHSCKITKEQIESGIALPRQVRIYSDCMYNKFVTISSKPASFTDEPVAVDERKKCGYPLNITGEIIENGAAIQIRPIPALSDSVYDKIITISTKLVPINDESALAKDREECNFSIQIINEPIESSSGVQIKPILAYSEGICGKPITISTKPAPTNDEPEAVAERKKCDHSIKITNAPTESLTALPRQVRIYSDCMYNKFVTISSKPASFSDEPVAVDERKKCGYPINITGEIIENGAAIQIRPIPALSDNVYDKIITISTKPAPINDESALIKDREECNFSIQIINEPIESSSGVQIKPVLAYSEGICGKPITISTKPAPTNDEPEAAAELEKCCNSIKINKIPVESSNAVQIRPVRVHSEGIHGKPITISSKPAPFSDEPEAVAEREKCDYSIKITKELTESGTALPRPVRVYSDGTYDLFHQGHARQLMQAKNSFPEVHLIVGIQNDSVTHQLKGKTLMSDQERYECVRHCRYVDEVYRAAPWVTNEEFLEENKIDFVAHDAIPYAMGSESDDVYHHLKVKGIFVATERTKDISTSDLVSRVLQNYDTHVRKNLDRGCERKCMNVSLLNEKRYLLQNRIDKIKSGLKRKREEFTDSCKKFSIDFIRGIRYFLPKKKSRTS